MEEEGLEQGNWPIENYIKFQSTNRVDKSFLCLDSGNH